jgi:hypothetical protein
VVHRRTISTGEDIFIDVSGLMNGMYFLQVLDEANSISETHRIIVKH